MLAGIAVLVTDHITTGRVRYDVGHVAGHSPPGKLRPPNTLPLLPVQQEEFPRIQSSLKHTTRRAYFINERKGTAGDSQVGPASEKHEEKVNRDHSLVDDIGRPSMNRELLDDMLTTPESTDFRNITPTHALKSTFVSTAIDVSSSSDVYSSTVANPTNRSMRPELETLDVETVVLMDKWELKDFRYKVLIVSHQTFPQLLMPPIPTHRQRTCCGFYDRLMTMEPVGSTTDY